MDEKPLQGNEKLAEAFLCPKKVKQGIYTGFIKETKTCISRWLQQLLQSTKSTCPKTVNGVL